MNKNAQTAMEYLMVVAFAFLLLVPVILISLSQSGRFQNDVSASQIHKIGAELSDTMDTVYYSGPPTKRTLKLYFPKGITDITYTDNRMVFTVQGLGGSYEYAIYAAADLVGSLSTFMGTHTVVIEAGDTYINVTG